MGMLMSRVPALLPTIPTYEGNENKMEQEGKIHHPNRNKNTFRCCFGNMWKLTRRLVHRRKILF